MRFLLLNPKSTFVEVRLTSGTITILPKSKAGPFNDNQVTPGLRLMLSRRILVAEEVAATEKPPREKKKSSRSKGDNK
jgi:hypothetical protein